MSCCHATKLTPPIPWWRLALGGALAGNIMTFSLAINLADEAVETRFYVHLALLLATSVVFGLLAGPFLLRLRTLWQQRAIDVEVLFASGMLGALLYSLHSTFFSAGPVYYEVVSILLVLYALSLRLKGQAQRHVEAELTRFLLQAAQVEVLQTTGSHYIEAQRVEVGMRVRVHPGQAIAVDGRVEQGQASVQTLSLSGEPFARAVSPGDQVFASWFCLDGTLVLRCERRGTAREVDRIGSCVRRGRAAHEDAAVRLPWSVELLSQRLTRIFAPLVALVATCTTVGWALAGDGQRACLHGLAVLLVACPCALGFAVPLGLRLGVLQLAAQGIQVRSLAAIERLAAVRRVAFDKTGTLTGVQVRFADMTLEPYVAGAIDFALDAPTLFALARAAQRLVDHPIAAAFATAPSSIAAPWVAEQARLLPGVGIEVVFADGPHRHLMRLADAPASSSRGKAVGLSIDGQLAATVQLRDVPFAQVPGLFASLAKHDIEAVVLSGDSQERVDDLAIAKGHGSMTASDKQTYVQDWQQDGRSVCFVGDGFNDTAAMASCSASLTVSNGTGLAREVADGVLPAGQPHLVLETLLLCRRTLRIVRGNVAIAVFYNVVGMSLAAAGHLQPVWAALLMLSSSLFVSARTMYFLQRPMKAC